MHLVGFIMILYHDAPFSECQTIPQSWAEARSPYRLYYTAPLLIYLVDVCLSVHRCICVEKKNHLDATEWFIALIICSTCFGHFYAHHQELKTICVLLPPMVFGACLLVVEVEVQDSRLCGQEEGCCTTCNIPLPGRIACFPAPHPRQPATKHRTP